VRYKLTEEVTLAGKLPAGTTVTIKVLDLETDTLVPLAVDLCVESAIIPGLYRWDTTNFSSDIATYKNFYYEMTNGDEVVSGKFVYGGYIDTQDTMLVDLQTAVTDVPTAEENATTLLNRVI
jgi:hypothetical protein